MQAGGALETSHHVNLGFARAAPSFGARARGQNAPPELDECLWSRTISAVQALGGARGRGDSLGRKHRPWVPRHRSERVMRPNSRRENKHGSGVELLSQEEGNWGKGALLVIRAPGKKYSEHFHPPSESLLVDFSHVYTRVFVAVAGSAIEEFRGEGSGLDLGALSAEPEIVEPGGGRRESGL